MKRFEAQEAFLTPALVARYAATVQRFKSRDDRLSSRSLLRFSAAGAEGFAVNAHNGETEILLYDEIGFWGVTAKDFVLALASAGPGPINLRINSPGGDVFDGLAIFNALRARTAPVRVTVDGIAASAASIIAMAGSSLEMPEQAMLMIHNCLGVCIGNRNDMLDMAAIQEKIDGQMADIYAKKSGKPAAEMAAAMDGETYYTSTEAKAVGLCDAIIEPAQMAALAASLHSPTGRLIARAAAEIRAAALPDYDPDGDGDNDAQEALTLIQAAADLLGDAAEALSGVDDDASEEAGDAPIVPGAAMTDEIARRRRLAQLAIAEA